MQTVYKLYTYILGSKSGIGKLRPAGQLRPVKGKSAAREHVTILNGMRPAKGNFAARKHVNVARRAKIYLSQFYFSNLT